MLTRLAHVALALPGRWRDRLYCRRLRGHGLIAVDAEFAPTARIVNAAGREHVRIGNHTLFHGEIIAYAPAGRVEIGDFCFVGPGAKLWSMTGIRIGSNVQISHGVQIFDNNSHSLDPEERGARFRELRLEGKHLTPETVDSRPVSIGDDVWIGFNAAVMKGVQIGRGAVVAAGAVVTRDVAPLTVVAGNPAVVVKRVTQRIAAPAS
jgi:acetyltransferase-like isoleucine patch superfamily enzyme